MFTTYSPETPEQAAYRAAAILRAERRLRIAAELTELGRELALAVQKRALAEEAAMDCPQDRTPAKSSGGAMAFAKLSRTVRLCLDMEVRAEAALTALHAGKPIITPDPTLPFSEGQDAANRVIKGKMRQVFREAVETEAQEDDLIEALRERLAHDEAYWDRGGEDQAVTIARLCHDLGIDPKHNHWTRQGWVDPPGTKSRVRQRWAAFNDVSGKTILPKSLYLGRWEVPPRPPASQPVLTSESP